jgi:predicted dehydrogenase
MSKTLGVAVVGCGYWGMNYVRIFNELLQTHVVVVCDERPERLQEVARRFSTMKLTTSVDEALIVPDVEGVIVCTEPTSHRPVVEKCLSAGKHVLVEKPITVRPEDAEALIRQANSAGLTLMVGHTFIFNPGVRKVKSYLQNQEAGQIYYLYAQRTNLGPIRNDVNALWDLAPHDISIFNYLLESTPEWVSAVGAKVLHNCREDVGFVTLGYPNGVLGHIHVSWVDPNKVREVVVVGSDKRIVFNDLNPMEQVRVFDKGVSSVPAEPESYAEHQLLMRDGDIISPRVLVSEPLKNQCLHFVECITQGVPPMTDGTSGYDVVRVMDAIDRSIAQRGAPVTIPIRSLA